MTAHDPGAGRPDPVRVADLAGRLEQVRTRLDAACARAARDPAEVDLLVVTKFFPAADVLALYDLGCRAFGESREPEAGTKADQVRAVVDDPIAFHMIGQIQRRKARSVGRWADVVHSLDSARLADALDVAVRTALDSGERSDLLDVLVQVNLDGAPDRGGVMPTDLDALAAAVRSKRALRLRGLMVIAPQSSTPAMWMERAAAIRSGFLDHHPDADEFSAGMSGDLDEAVRHGSTCVRVGTAIMGARPLVSP
ncbi:YggS family pyridoxal phosphate-dependent enzyme [Williamsia sp. CHRR-6]|uniref:YggS family pyridoxal phosphate-dependent enzyme n=1 Tax=Williamsia sp. CHRR-6 TaxID=2835871 RepID=UPI001BDB14BF|nr:YggS family pyridoxal phosphate-dependent enzyme [Williamsia sp. CHRR-6]MBT0565256.1 YggS family pyridoxal phosphate-dependent enzyme [Williamsia sp. CHRR-6]